MKPKLAISIFVFSLISFVSCRKSPEGAAIQITSLNPEIDTIYLSLSPFDQATSYKFDTIGLNNGFLHFDTAINEPHSGVIICPEMFLKLDDGREILDRSKAIEFFLYPNENLDIEASINSNITEYFLKGKELNQQHNSYWQIIKELRTEESDLMFKYENLFLSSTATSIMFSEIEMRMGEINAEIKEKRMKFIQDHPDFEYSAFLLLQCPKDTIKKYYGRLNEATLELPFGEILKSKIDTWMLISKGNISPEIEYQTLQGETFRSNEFRGKYLVLDFWGSWCAPCIDGIPKMKEYYSAYKEQVEFVGIACRDQRENLEPLIKKLGIDWIQILNKTGENDLSTLFAIEGYPTKIIINPEGKIEGIFLGESEEFYLALDEYLSQTL